MKEIEYKALRRDYGVCQECKKKGKLVHADRVVMIDINKELVLSNLTSLCNVCLHQKSDKKINKKLELKEDVISNNVQ